MARNPMFVLSGVGFTYHPNTPLARPALRHIDLTIPSGARVGITGTSGGGKSTLLQVLAGLITPQTGTLKINGRIIVSEGKIIRRPSEDKKWFTSTIGLQFQFAEHQLFADTVWDDVASGPRWAGLPPEEIQARVEEALQFVGLSPDEYSSRNPFTLSGGEARKVALAGILANKPTCLLLDEPTAGLDPKTAHDLRRKILSWQQSTNSTLVLVSHDGDELGLLAERMIIIAHGEIIDDFTWDACIDPNKIKGHLLNLLPTAARITLALRRRGFPLLLRKLPTDIDSAYELLVESFTRLDQADSERRVAPPSTE